MNHQKHCIKFLIAFALVSTSITYTMKRKAEQSLEQPLPNRPLHKYARTSDDTAHQLWRIHSFNAATQLNTILNNTFNNIRSNLAEENGSQIITIEQLVQLLKHPNNLTKSNRKKIKKLKYLKGGTDGAYTATGTLASLQGTRVFTNTIYDILTTELLKPRTEVASAMQQTVLIIEKAIIEFYDTHLASYNDNLTFEQILHHNNNDFGTSLHAIQTSANLFRNGTLSRAFYVHLHDLARGRQSALEAIESESSIQESIK